MFGEVRFVSNEAISNTDSIEGSLGKWFMILSAQFKNSNINRLGLISNYKAHLASKTCGLRCSASAEGRREGVRGYTPYPGARDGEGAPRPKKCSIDCIV